MISSFANASQLVEGASSQVGAGGGEGKGEGKTGSGDGDGDGDWVGPQDPPKRPSQGSFPAGMYASPGQGLPVASRQSTCPMGSAETLKTETSAPC